MNTGPGGLGRPGLLSAQPSRAAARPPGTGNASFARAQALHTAPPQREVEKRVKHWPGRKAESVGVLRECLMQLLSNLWLCKRYMHFIATWEYVQLWYNGAIHVWGRQAALFV